MASVESANMVTVPVPLAVLCNVESLTVTVLPKPLMSSAMPLALTVLPARSSRLLFSSQIPDAPSMATLDSAMVAPMADTARLPRPMAEIEPPVIVMLPPPLRPTDDTPSMRMFTSCSVA